jgi:(p)ppGpp synthase/HD superfamily hydrolase
MNAKILLNLAVQISDQAHVEQFRKDGSPYINHIERVASAFDDPILQAVARLHDVVEDSYINLEYLGERFPSDVVLAVDALTKRKDEDYDDYLDRVLANGIARKVKLVDIADNLSDDPSDHAKEKYRKALKRFALEF